MDWDIKPMVNEALAYVNENEARFIDELKEFLRFPSVSSQSAHTGDVMECARWLRNHLASLGLEARLVEGDGHPIVQAKGSGQSNRRLIIYGHYDVQPADSNDEWDSPPFEPAVRDGYIFGRGTTDDKGQLFAHVKGVEALLRTAGHLPCDVMFLIEGEEESGGTSLQKFVQSQKADLAPDAVVISDTSMYDEHTPALTYGLRGLLAVEVTVHAARRDLHSGVFGGAVANPGIALARIIAACMEPEGNVIIPGFYDDVRPLEEWERQNVQRLQFDEGKFLSEAGAATGFGEKGYSALERVWARPTFDVNGLLGGYTGRGVKTIIPSRASAKISMRLVPDQDPGKVFELVTKHIKSVCPGFIRAEISGPVSSSPPVLFNVEDPVIQVAKEALKFGFGSEALLIRCGGSIPVAGTFWQELKKPVVLMGFGLDSDGAHSSNEHFKIESFINGVKTSAYFIDAFAGQ